MVIEGETPLASAKTTGLGIVELSTVFNHLGPDVVLSIADRYETLATAVAASYMNIPVAHVQGGEITGSIDEKVRHAVTKLSNIHFVANEKAAERVIRMGEDPSAVHVTGCPSIDIARAVLENPALNFSPIEKYSGVGADIRDLSRYLVVLQHPVTSEYTEARAQITETLYAVRDSGIPAFWFWPNIDAGSDGTSKGIRVFRENEANPNIHFFKNMLPEDFLRLVYNSCCIVGNSSVAIRECSYLGVPSVNIGSRQDGRDRGINVIDVGYDRREILNAINIQLKNGKYPTDTLYGDGYSGKRIADLLATAPIKFEKKLMFADIKR